MNINIEVVQCYAPTSDVDEERKRKLLQQDPECTREVWTERYENNDGIIQRKDKHRWRRVEHVTGKHGPRRMGTGCFWQTSAHSTTWSSATESSKDIKYKATWESPDHVIENQIDYVCIG